MSLPLILITYLYNGWQIKLKFMGFSHVYCMDPEIHMLKSIDLKFRPNFQNFLTKYMHACY